MFMDRGEAFIPPYFDEAGKDVFAIRTSMGKIFTLLLIPYLIMSS